MRFLRDGDLGGRIHLIIAIRDQVFLSINRSEHITRYIQDNHILQLRWNYEATKFFLESKIKNLSRGFFLKDGEKTLHNWLGINEIENKVRGFKEPIVRYILRHTRCIPRDVVILGNAISLISRDCKTNNTGIDEKRIRAVIRENASVFGQEILRICAAQLNVDVMPYTAGVKEYSEVYTSVDEYRDETMQKLRNIVLSFNSEYISWEDIENVLNQYSDQLIGNFFDILWQNGGIGYIEKDPEGDEVETFVIDIGYSEFLLPKYKKKYVFRGCIYDFVGRPENFRYNAFPPLGGRD